MADDMHGRDRSMMPKYFWYVITLFAGYYLADLADLLKDAVSAPFAEKAIRWFVVFLVMSFLWGGVFAGINDRQAGRPARGLAGFLRHGLRHFVQFLVIKLLLVTVSLGVAVSFAIAAALLGSDPQAAGEPSRLFHPLQLLVLPFLALRVFWCAAIVVEGGRMGRSLVRSVRLLATTPAALLAGLVWGGISIADEPILTYAKGTAAAAGILAAKNGVLAAAAVAIFAYAIAACRKAKAEVYGEALDEEPGRVLGAEWQNALVVACGFLVFVSFVPLIHFAALGVGLAVLVRGQRFSMRALCAACLGGFFSIAYILGTMGWFLPKGAPPATPGYQFLAEADPSLQDAAASFESGDFWAAERALAEPAPDEQKQTWAYHCAMGIARTNTRDADAAVAAFERGLAMEPEGGAFHYYYGLAQVNQNELGKAAASFRLALERDPTIADAQRRLDLLANAHESSKAETAVVFVVVLLFLFTVHEFAHGYAAYKLGDDTAKLQGRLTLNPLAHLDLFGSIILPGLLIFRQSEVVFGWARPVPVNTANFADPRKGNMVASFAGPAMNLAVAMAGFLVLMVVAFGVRLVAPEAASLNLANPFLPVAITGVPAAAQLAVLIMLLKQLVFTSLVLGFFNLIPVPPLDGSWILSGILPESAAGHFEKLRPFGFVLFLALVFTPLLDIFLAIPLGLAWLFLYGAFAALGFG